MYIITNNEDVIKAISSVYELDEEHRNIILDDYNIAYAPNEVINAFEVSVIPEGIEVDKYCYTETDGFTLNPNYVEPASSLEDRVTALETDSLQDETDINALEDAVIELAEDIAEIRGGSV